MLKFINSPYFLLISISFLFLVAPFFWLKPGEMDLGGDSSRLYFYDPIAYLRSFSIYNVSSEGMGGIAPNYYFLPFLLMLAGIKLLVVSPTLLITIFNILKLFGGFLAMYFVIRTMLEIISSEKSNKSQYINIYSALLGGLFYILSPIATGNWDKALTSHFQIVLNPLMFLLILKFFTTDNVRYIWIALFVSVVFSPNFGFTSTPPFFAFYPLAILFLFLFLWISKSNKVSWKKIISLPFIFFGLHAFHLIPQVISLFDPGSYENIRVFDRQSIAHEGIRYFYGVLPLAKVSLNILLPTISNILQFANVLVPFCIIFAFIFIKKKQPIFLLTGLFVIITVYLLSANITQAGVDLYKNLFYIPGFSMFRNFIGQWGMVYIFFYSLLFGFSIKIIFNKIPYPAHKYVAVLIASIFFISSWGFIKGDQVNKVIATSNNVKIPIEMDPAYARTLDFIKNIPDEGKILILPFSDSFYQVIAGKNGGAYVGSSSISYLTDKKSFSGYQIITPAFSERLFTMSREKDYDGIKRLLKYLGVKYIFYNSDPRIYDKEFPASPYSYARQSLPNTQNEYKEFVSKISGKKIFEINSYQLFEVNESNYLPLFYTAKNVGFYSALNKENLPDPSLFLKSTNNDIRKVYLDNDLCSQFIERNNCSKGFSSLTTPNISFSKVDPTKYIIDVYDARAPYFLVFANAYHQKWKIFLSETKSQREKSYFNGEIKEIIHNSGLIHIDVRHFKGNGYANVWYVTPQDVNNAKDYRLIVEMTVQRIFYYSLVVSLIVFIIFLGWGLRLFFPKQLIGIIKNK